MNNKNNNIGSILKKYRIERNLTQEQVAEKTALATKYLSQLERGLSKGSIRTIITLCDFFEITPNRILGRFIKKSCFLRFRKL